MDRRHDVEITLGVAMGGILLLLVGTGWLVLCIALSSFFTKGIQHGPARFLLACVVFVGLLLAPVADDILGSRAYAEYCAAADEQVKILGTVEADASTNLFSPNGEWRLALLAPSQHDERLRLQRAADSLVRWEHGTSEPTASLFPVTERTTKIYDARSDRLLAQFTSYHYRGGLLRSSVLDSSSQCFPKQFGNALYKKLFVPQRPDLS